MSLKEVEADIKGDQLKSLYEAVAHLGEGKKQADKKQFELDGVLRNYAELRFEKEFQEQELQSVSLASSHLYIHFFFRLYKSGTSCGRS